METQLPQVFLPILQEHHIDPATIRVWAQADKMPNGMYMDALLAITDDALVVAWGCLPGHKVVRFGAFAELSAKKKPDMSLWQGHHCEVFPLANYGKMTAVKLITGYTVLLECGDVKNVETPAEDGKEAKTEKQYSDEVRLVSYTNIHQSMMDRFIVLFNKKQEGEKWTEDDLHIEDHSTNCPNCGMKYPDEHRSVCPKCMDKGSLMKRLLQMLKPYRWQIVFMLTGMLVASVAASFEPYFSGTVLFDMVLAKDGRFHGMIGYLVLALVTLRVLVMGLGILIGRTSAGVSANLIFDLKTRIFSAMQRLSLSFFSRQQTGRLMSRVNRDANRILYFFVDGVPFFLQNVAIIIFVFALMFSMNWKLTLLVLIPFPIVVLSFQYLFPLFERLWRKEWSHQSRMNALINDSLKGARVLRAFGKEDTANTRFGRINLGLRNVVTQAGRLDSVAFPLLNFLIGLSLLTIWGLGGWQVLQGNMTFGTLITFTGFMNMLYGPLDFMVYIVRWYSDSMTSAQRMFEIIDTPPEVAEAAIPQRIERIDGSVSVRNVTFSYEVGKKVLKDVSVEVKAGQMLGIVGQSGAGKSTLVNLMCRLYDPVEGEIFIDGINLKDAKISDLTSQISVVSQETYIFAGSVADNIAYAKPDCDRVDIIAAAKSAGAHEFIMKLPEGYDTMLGANGRDLSGGERQRVSIARALLQDPRILILDEATSAVDTQTERVIQNAIEMLAKGRTTISIAHRLSTLRNADHLVVLEDGKIVEAGTHLELIQKKGTFHKLMQMQAEALKFRGVGDE